MPARVGAVLLAAGFALAACSGSSPAHPPAAAPTQIAPGAGQSTLAGLPGASGTGAPASAPAPATSMSGMAMTAPSGGTSAGAAAPVAGNAVAIKNFAFAPAALTVKVGTTVTWTNQDTDAHTVTSQNNAGPLASAALNTGQSYSYTFTQAGTYSYLCTIHPFMTATVTVTQ
jgi:plastocyanin